MKIHGLNKLTLLDYPGHMACTVFAGHCNMRCPFCHNAPLVLFPDTQPQISQEDFFTFLKKRRGILEGVCITGGEPTLAPDLSQFIEKIRAFGYRIKLDTNGTNPDLLRHLVTKKQIDFVAMDIKSSLTHYAEVAGIPDFCTDTVRESADFLMRGEIPYEFRTTVVRELHNADVFLEIGDWLHGANAYYLQAFEKSDNLICRFLKTSETFSAYSLDELKEFLPLLSPHFKQVALRGI